MAVTHQIEIVDGAGLVRLMAQDPRNADAYQRLPHLNPGEIHREQHHVATTGGLIIGIASTQLDAQRPTDVEIKRVAVDPDWREQGLGRSLLTSVFRHTQELGLVLRPGHFLTMGEERLLPMMPALHQRFNDLFIRWDAGKGPIDGCRRYSVSVGPDKKNCVIRYNR